MKNKDKTNGMITNEIIDKLNPCKDRFNNYLKHYINKSHTNEEFMNLENITHDDKLWVAFRLMPKDNMRLATADIAESVLHIFEAKYPNDDRPRKAIEAARSGKNVKAADDAAYAASYAATAAAYAASYAATAAAYAAAYAAGYAANAAYYAAGYANAAYYAAAYYAANAANAAYYAASDRVKQKKLIRTIILKYWKE